MAHASMAAPSSSSPPSCPESLPVSSSPPSSHKALSTTAVPTLPQIDHVPLMPPSCAPASKPALHSVVSAPPVGSLRSAKGAAAPGIETRHKIPPSLQAKMTAVRTNALPPLRVPLRGPSGAVGPNWPRWLPPLGAAAAVWMSLLLSLSLAPCVASI
jgi:hypothetical protein